METTLRFLTFLDQVKFEELDLSCVHWLDLQNLEMELLEFLRNLVLEKQILRPAWNTFEDRRDDKWQHT